MNIDPLEEILEDPDKVAKLHLLMTGAIIATTILITVGAIIGILWLVGVI